MTEKATGAILNRSKGDTMKKLGQLVGSGLAAFALIGLMAFLVSIGDKIVKAMLGGGAAH